MFSIDNESRQALQDWGTEKIDQLIFDAMLTSPSSIFYKTDDSDTTVLRTATAATAKSAISTAAESKLSLGMLSFIKTWALTGGGRTNALTPLRPVSVEGRKYFVMLVHPDCLYDLRNSSAFQQAMREAEVRGPSNPLFQGATAIWDGVVVHEHENIPIATDGGGGAIPWAHCLFMGASAGLFAWGKRPAVIQKNFDYENEHGYAWNMIAKAKKSIFNSKDFGSVSVYLARTNVSGA
jgi:N4-gp56 family major capsid protein